jgi:hypothetical protein
MPAIHAVLAPLWRAFRDILDFESGPLVHGMDGRPAPAMTSNSE